jgi:two-component system, cell cycle sensor histidine kinase and response regulator CckA
MEQWLAATLRSVGDALIATDVSGRITYLNAVVTRLTGWTLEEAQGLEFDVVFPLTNNSGQPIEGPMRQVLREGLVVDLAEGTHLTMRDGRRLPVEDSAAPIRDEAGAIIGCVIVLRDGTAQYRTQDRLRETEEQLRHSRKLESVGRLASGLAHDFNNLITIILGYSEILRDIVPGTAGAREPLENIRYAGQRASELTHRLLAFSRKQVLDRQILNLNEVIGSLAGMLEPLIGETVQLDLQLDSSLHAVRADRGQLEQVILNLAANARDAMPHGGRLSVRTVNLHVDRASSALDEGVLPGHYVVVEVTDTGVGMNEETRRRIFEPFFTTKDPGKGTGLGLATVYDIVRQSGGTIHVYSDVGRGTTFRIYLPRCEHEPASMSTALATPKAAGYETILVVEDNQLLRDLIETVLRQARYSTIVCADGETALERMQGGAAVDAMLLDMVMPRMSGPELVERLRALTPDAKVLFMSGYAEDAVWINRPHAHAQAPFIQKPFTVTDLCVKLRQVLDA